jgi:hypothetical protein
MLDGQYCSIHLTVLTSHHQDVACWVYYKKPARTLDTSDAECREPVAAEAGENSYRERILALVRGWQKAVDNDTACAEK